MAGIRLMSCFQIETDTGVSFSASIPPSGIMARLSDMINDAKKRQQSEMLTKITQSPETKKILAASGFDMAAIMSKPEAVEVILGQMDLGALIALGEGPGLAHKHEIAQIVQPFCLAPNGLDGEDGKPLSWEEARALNEPMVDQILYLVATEMHARVEGELGLQKLKNSNSSSP